jgi:hypothetical protein
LGKARKSFSPFFSMMELSQRIDCRNIMFRKGLIAQI